MYKGINQNECLNQKGRTYGFTNAKFADDLTLFKSFLHNMPSHFVINELEACQHRLHLWGQTNRVVFDASKEHFRIIATTQNEGEPFKFIGQFFDTTLTMREEVGRVRSKASPKVKALLLTRPFYSIAAMVLQFKTHVLCLLEGTVSAIFHAATSHLDILDGIQDKYVRDIGLTVSDAFLNHNLAPLCLRRDIGSFVLFA